MGVEEAVEQSELSEVFEDGAEAPKNGPSAITKDEYLTIKEAARYLSISEPVLRLTIRCGKIPAKRGRGGHAMVSRRHLLPFLDPSAEGPGAGGQGSGDRA